MFVSGLSENRFKILAYLSIWIHSTLKIIIILNQNKCMMNSKKWEDKSRLGKKLFMHGSWVI